MTAALSPTPSGQSVRVGLLFPELPEWECTELRSAEGCRIRAVRNGGITSEMAGARYEDVIAEIKRWALEIDHGTET